MKTLETVRVITLDFAFGLLGENEANKGKNYISGDGRTIGGSLTKEVTIETDWKYLIGFMTTIYPIQARVNLGQLKVGSDSDYLPEGLWLNSINTLSSAKIEERIWPLKLDVNQDKIRATLNDATQAASFAAAAIQNYSVQLAFVLQKSNK
ncbi:hypothetical protein SAMN05421780_12413 [Flexibacter flexilis DSM 6793]|uniref:Uncharacterized protein n=1 Tax=Flexibacter flexilis DSM 6793 TaxID=927664 RepID=A0A1I1NYL9_9BACT|nr:hypothetical protein [Flexibacter flexilis]SFD02689.1 hypothetical protein SAMN05421780_12413 [Flexibacter flexilis DSM 6793]